MDTQPRLSRATRRSALQALSLAWACLSVAHAQAKCPEGAKEGQTLRRSNNTVAKAEIADPVGFCSNHATRDLLHQALCAKTSSNDSPENCFQPAVMDFLGADAAGKPFMRNSNYALSEILKQRHVASEACLPMTGFFKPPMGEDPKSYKTFDEKFLATTHDVILKECLEQKQAAQKAGPPNTDKDTPSKPCPDCAMRTAQRPLEIQATLDTHETDCLSLILSAKRKDFLYSAIQKHLAKNPCKRATIPEFVMGQLPIDSDAEKNRRNLEKLLDDGHAVRLVNTSQHAFVVSNYRVVCKDQQEHLEFELLDSLHSTRWSPARGAPAWAEGGPIVQQLEPRADLLWIERPVRRPPPRSNLPR